MGNVTALRPSFIGLDHVAARVQLSRALDAGIRLTRAQVLANIASFVDGWVFRKSIAKHLGISVRTVQRAINDGKREGLCGVARAKQGEVPKGWPARKDPPWCGFSHRWMIGRDAVGEAAKALIAMAKATVLARAATAAGRSVARRLQQRTDEKRQRHYEEQRAAIRRLAAEELAARGEPPPD